MHQRDATIIEEKSLEILKLKELHGQKEFKNLDDRDKLSKNFDANV